MYPRLFSVTAVPATSPSRRMIARLSRRRSSASALRPEFAAMMARLLRAFATPSSSWTVRLTSRLLWNSLSASAVCPRESATFASPCRARAQRAAGAHRVLEPDAGALVVALALVELTELATGHGLGEAVASRRSELERAAEASVGGLVVPGERLDLAQSQQDRDGLLLRDD